MATATDSALAWSYDGTANRYRTPDGRFVGAQAITSLRNAFLDATVSVVRSLAADLASDVLDIAAWESAMQDAIKTTLGVEYVFGRGGLDNMTSDDYDALSALVETQLGYLDGFAAAVMDGTLTEAQIAARAELYIGSGTGAYERGAAAASDIDLPVYPGDDCEGGNRCRCRWSLNLAEDGSIEAYWIAEDDACEVCADHAEEYNPYTE